MGLLSAPNIPPSEYLAALFLGACGVSSLFSFATQARARTAEGKIKLPDYEDAEWDSRLELSGESIDPFDVAKPEDMVDGYPIDEDAFWKKDRRRKFILTGLFSLIVATQAAHLGWSYQWTRFIAPKTTVLVTRALHVTYSLYVLALSFWSISINDVEENWMSLVHLSALTGLFTISQVSIALLPTESPSSPTSIGLWYTSIGLYLVATLVVVRTKRGPKLHYPAETIYSEKVVKATTTFAEDNVCGLTHSSVWDFLLFSYSSKVVMLGHTAESLEIGDLPILPVGMRATPIFTKIQNSMKNPSYTLTGWIKTRPGSGWGLAFRLWKLNWVVFCAQWFLAASSAVAFYGPPYFLRKVVQYLEDDKDRKDMRWGWVFCAGLVGASVALCLISSQLWSISSTTLQVRLKVQMNSILFAKTLVRKDVASTAPSSDDAEQAQDGKSSDKKDEGFSSKAQIMTLMTTDVDMISLFSWHSYTLVDAPVEILVGTMFLYKLIGSSAFLGILATCLCLPMNHYASKIVVGVQSGLMKARDERVSLMNEVLGAIRMLKFMAWERSFEKRVLGVREKELDFQRSLFKLEIVFNAIWGLTPLIVTLVSFWHFAVVRNQTLTPSIAFTSIAVFTQLKFALNALPEAFIDILQGLVSLRRIEEYLGAAEIAPVPPLDGRDHPVALQSATITWAQARDSGSNAVSVASTPNLRRRFVLVDLSLNFPLGEFSLICGKLGSGKTLLLLSLLGETELLAGQVVCPRSPPNVIASFKNIIPRDDEWVVPGVCAYVPQTAWLQNASIRENILFNLPYVESRYQKTLEACALISDLTILEDGDESEIGERGVNLSGGQKARISLARAVYSRASLLLLDDVLSAVDAHTADHLFYNCLKGELMRDRTIILVSHHVQLCASGAKYIVALENGRAAYTGNYAGFSKSSVMAGLTQSDDTPMGDQKVSLEGLEKVEKVCEDEDDASESGSTAAASGVALNSKSQEKKGPRKLIEEEIRAVGRVKKDVWETYVHACGGSIYWVLFVLVVATTALSPVLENGWLKIWSGDAQTGKAVKGPAYYLTVYAVVTVFGLFMNTLRWFVLFRGSINASVVLYRRLLETVLFANIRFHDTISRGRLLNRFGKDFEEIDGSLSDMFGRTWFRAVAVITTITTICAVGGLPFLVAVVVIGFFYYKVAEVYGQCSRDLRRLDSVSRSPLYSMYGETIAGVPVVRAFGASSKFLRDMLQCVDTNVNPYYWTWGVNRWMFARFSLLSSLITGAVAVIALLTPGIDASLAGFVLAFVLTISNDVLFLVRHFVSLEQSMVALERVKEFSDLPRESAEFVEPRPPLKWPTAGRVEVQDLVIRYAPELPSVLHNISFSINPGEKVGILGRTGSGKSTLALSFFRFVEASEGRILVDGIDISKIGLTDLRSKLTIIPQDPTILSGTLRSTLDVFGEYDDAEIYEALRRVHLIRNDDTLYNEDEEVNANVFRNLDAPVSEGGENFSTGEKQLLCMARAILKRSRVLVMDEATASVDYATDELIGKTIRDEFASSTILTIAHRLRTVIDYNRVMVLDNGRVAEFDSPAKLIADPSSMFYRLCQATGKTEFATLRRMALQEASS